MLHSRLTVGVTPGLLLSLYLLVIYLSDIEANLGDACPTCTGTNETCINGTCVCEEGFYDSNGIAPGGTCYPKLDLGSTCPTLVGEKVCKESNAICIDGICACGSNYYDDNGATFAGTCQLKLDLGFTCPSIVLEKGCKDSNATCIDGNCACVSNYYDDNGALPAGTCQLKRDLGFTCPAMVWEKGCIDHHATCIEGKCACGSNYYDDNGAIFAGTCQLKLDLGSTCPTIVLEKGCKDANATCIDGNCACGSNYYDDNGASPAGTCQLKLDLGSICPTVGEKGCKDSNATCSGGKCTCGSNYYDDNGALLAGTCQLITNLRVTFLDYGSITENTIPISWTPPNDRAAVSYYRVAYGPADTITVVNQINVGNQTSFVLNSLDPGKKYSISVFSVDTQTDLTERNTSVTKNQTTKPGIPGALVKHMDIDASSGNITLEWNRSIGVVTGYGGRLENTTLFIYNKTFNTSETTSQAFSELKSGTWYKFTVQAVVGYADTKTLYSDIHTQFIKTKVQAPNPPTNLNCFNETDRAITLKWIQPQLPNGDIISYIIVIQQTQPSQEPYNITSQGTNVLYTVNWLTAGNLVGGKNNINCIDPSLIWVRPFMFDVFS